MKVTRKLRLLEIEYKDGRREEIQFERGYYSKLLCKEDNKKHPSLVLWKNGKRYKRINLDDVEMVHFFSYRFDV